MTTTRRMGRVLAAVLAVLASTGLVVAPVAPASAAPLGAVTLGQQEGTVTDTPMFTTATTSAPCPGGFGANALIRIGRPEGPFTNLARPLTAGGYDRAPVTFRPDRSFETALAGRPADGAWLIVVECFSPEAGRLTDRFVTPVTVAGTAWRVGAPAAGAPTASDRPGGGAAPPAVTSNGSPPVPDRSDPGAGPADARHTPTSGERELRPGGIPVEYLTGGVAVLVGLIVGAVLMARRGRTGSAGRS